MLIVSSLQIMNYKTQKVLRISTDFEMILCYPFSIIFFTVIMYIDIDYFKLWMQGLHKMDENKRFPEFEKMQR